MSSELGAAKMTKIKFCTMYAEITLLACLSIGFSLRPALCEGVKSMDPEQVKQKNLSKVKTKAKLENSAKSVSKVHEHLVPPPPPDEPALLVAPGSHDLPFAYEYMNKDLLSARLKDLQKQLGEARQELEDKITQAQDNKEKSVRFSELYNEGVVSRRELEESEKAAADSQREVEKFKASVTELEIRSAIINQKLQPSGARPTVKKAKPSIPNLTHQGKH